MCIYACVCVFIYFYCDLQREGYKFAAGHYRTSCTRLSKIKTRQLEKMHVTFFKTLSYRTKWDMILEIRKLMWGVLESTPLSASKHTPDHSAVRETKSLVVYELS